MPAAVDRAGALLAAAVLLVFGFLPWANWIPGGHSAEWYGIVLEEWVTGGALVVGTALLLAILSRRLPLLWRPGALHPLLARYDAHPLAVTAAIALTALVLYLTLAVVIFDTKPLLIDEIIQVFQARTFASGRLVREAFPYPEFFSSMHLIDGAGVVYGQFPAGGPAMLAFGALIGAEWVVGPVAAAATVFAFGWLVQRLDMTPGVRLGATLLFAFAPFAVFMSSSHMNHVTVLLWLVVAMGGLVVATERDRAPFAALVCGLGLGLAATIRPADALAFALPAGVWLLARTLRRLQRWPDLLLSGLGVALPILAMLWVNARTTGDPLLFGYTVLWGDAHDIGFHGAPWGEVHTPLRGVELINLYVLRLQTYLFEGPFASLVPAALALLLVRRLSAFDRYLLVSSGAIVALYFAYWHDGFYLGPRFMYPLLPALVLWTARLPGLVRDRWGDRLPHRTVSYAYGIAIVMVLLPNGRFANATLRGTEYAHGLLTPRWDADGAADEAGVRNALILVRESWGAQIMARLWARGIDRSEAELLYREVDTCMLEEQITALEAGGVRGPEASASLRPLLADSARVIDTPHSPDPTERYLPSSFYSERCLTRIGENWQGFTLYPPLILAGANGNVFARDLHARDTLLLEAFPDRPIYLLKPEDTRVAAAKRFYPVRRDSLREAWGLDRLP